ncbi:MAG: FxLYD domain-containing protein [Dehalococcoidia bacterium]|jgi:hypothetical protein
MKKICMMIVALLAFTLALATGCSNHEDTPPDEIEQLQIIDHRLTVHEFTGDNPKSTAVITGTAQNTGDTTINKAVLTANFYTKDGELLATESAVRDNLAPGEKWTFTIQTSSPDAWKVKRYEVFSGSK